MRLSCFTDAGDERAQFRQRRRPSGGLVGHIARVNKLTSPTPGKRAELATLLSLGNPDGMLMKGGGHCMGPANTCHTRQALISVGQQ